MKDNIYLEYIKLYPKTNMNKKATFTGLFDVLDTYKSVYEYLEIDNSTVRERVFQLLADYSGNSYITIFEQWLSGEEQ